jgi:2-polyprenyl-3-methyl-5-hydroxy-6-metoxy-1,4-benzoquinol methylase
VSDFVGPTGNATDKYGDTNPVTRTLLGRFLRRVDEAIQSIRPDSILDVGCGEGIVTERLARRTGVPTVGVDIGDDVMRRQWSKRSASSLTFAAASAYSLPFDDASFDCVCALEVLEHLERPRDALAEMARVARRTMLLSVPREPLWRLSHLLAGRDVRALGNTPGHVNHWSAREFVELASAYGRVRSVFRPFPWTIVVVDIPGR